MLFVPIRTESAMPRNPYANVAIITVNAALYLLFNMHALGPKVAGLSHYFMLSSSDAHFYQFFTYQFCHADLWHLGGNMLFLWVFGNSVNAKLGQIPYLLFYLGGGVFAGWGYCLTAGEAFTLVGASGAIAAITTAYMALFPRDHVMMLLWLFFFIRILRVPALILIGLKIILWDNILAPSFGPASNVAYHAHLAGYLFGFFGALLLLAVRAVPRDHFDILALFKQWRRRRAYAAAYASPEARAQARFGSVARIPPTDAHQRDREEKALDQVTSLRSAIAGHLAQGETEPAIRAYQQLVLLDPNQCLSERDQIGMARLLYTDGRFPQAAAAFERFLQQYGQSSEAHEVRMLLGIVYARDLKQYEAAQKQLTAARPGLRDAKRQAQCDEWLTEVRTTLGQTGAS